MNAVLNRIDALHKELAALLPMKAEYKQKLDKKIRLEFNYNSNHIEGNTLTYGETELLLIYGQTKGSHDIREYEEIKAHDVAFHSIKEWAASKDKVLTEADIRNLNEIILVQPFWKEAITPDGQASRKLIKIGQYKESPNYVRLQNGEIFNNYASPAETPIKMGELMEWFRNEEEKKELHPVALAALFHYKFVCIHPFDDGNGRISRLLMNYVLLKNSLPPVVIKSNAKKEYLNALHLADTGDLEVFIDYIGEQLFWSFDIYLKAARGERVDEKGDWDKKLKILKDKHNYKENVQIEISKDAIIKCFKNSLIPLFAVITNKLNQYDSFFLTRTENVILKSYGSLVGEAINIKAAAGILEKVNIITSLSYAYILTGVRDKNRGANASINIVVNFHQLVYEILIPETTPYTKLYHEKFTDEECNLIAERIGNIYHEKVELLLQS